MAAELGLLPPAATSPIGDPIRWLKAIKRKNSVRTVLFPDVRPVVFAAAVQVLRRENRQTVSTNTYRSLWNEVQAEYGIEFPAITDYRIEETVAFIAKYRIRGNNQIWHVMNQSWLEKTRNRKDGQHFTPEFIKRFMVWVYPPAPKLLICDPCGGSGGFLTTAADEMDEIEPELFHYYDIDANRALKSAKMALRTYAHKTGKSLAAANMAAQDTLATEWPKMDRIYTNVPFGIKIQDPSILCRL